ncbi:MAG TPA: DedA family protein [Nitrospirota bacterium]|nr:DedA family protein [Nitrospirota bacterium]
MENGIPHISGLLEHFPYIGLFLLLVLGGIGFPFPEDTTLILCGFLIATEVVDPIYALSVVYSGMLITDFGLYSVGKKYGRKIVTHRRFHKIISSERLLMLQDKFVRKGTLFILVGRHLAVLRAQIFLTAGVMRMPAAKFLASDAVSSLFTIAIMVGAGYAGGHSLQVIKRDMTRIEHIGIFLAVILLAGYLIFRYVRSRRNEPGRT